MKILIVDDNILYAESMASFLKLHDFEIAGIAKNALEALVQVELTMPDIILMDIRMKGCNGIEATRMIKKDFPKIEIVMLTVSEDDDDLFAAVKAGASGYLLKNMVDEDFLAKLNTICFGEVPLAPGFTKKLLRQFAREGTAAMPAPKAHLTGRQKEILQLLVKGFTYREISEILHIQTVTVQYHVDQLINKLHLVNRTQLIAWAAGFDQKK